MKGTCGAKGQRFWKLVWLIPPDTNVQRYVRTWAKARTLCSGVNYRGCFADSVNHLGLPSWVWGDRGGGKCWWYCVCMYDRLPIVMPRPRHWPHTSYTNDLTQTADSHLTYFTLNGHILVAVWAYLRPGRLYFVSLTLAIALILRIL